MTAQVVVPAAEPRARSRLPRPLWWAPLVVPAVLTALIVLALAGAARNDAAIDARTGQATAEVLAVSPSRTVVQFPGPDNQLRRPAEGLGYPSGLRVGQLVRVEYDTAEPERVRVANRSWVVGLPRAVVTVALAWVLVLPVCWWLRRRS